MRTSDSIFSCPNPSKVTHCIPFALAFLLLCRQVSGNLLTRDQIPSDPLHNKANTISLKLQQQQQPQQQPQHAQTPQNQAQQQLMQQLRNRQGFLQGLATFLSHRGTPLPATITGMQAPNWNPENTPWKPLEPGTEIGTFKLAGKNIDIHRLFNMVFQVGGSTKVRIYNLHRQNCQQFVSSR